VFRSRGLRWEGHVTQVMKRKYAYESFVGKPHGKRQTDRRSRRHRRENNLEIYFRDIGCKDAK
jgi:hypothetical protein